jgi:hypothetical protein
LNRGSTLTLGFDLNRTTACVAQIEAFAGSEPRTRQVGSFADVINAFKLLS